MKYFKLDEVEKQEIPQQKGYKAVLVKDTINNIGFYRLEKTEELIEIEELKQQLEATDYQAIKYAEGLISEEEYEPIKAERQAWRDKINELEARLGLEAQNNVWIYN